MRENLIKLGISIKSQRRKCGMTLAEVAEKTGLTGGLLSKIENFRAIPSLPVLLKIAAALQITPAELLSGIGETAAAEWTVVRKKDRITVERESSRGFTYEMLLDREVADSNLQTLVLSIEPGAVREKVKTDGREFVYILKGEIVFWLRDEKIELSEGDLLFFDGRIEHVPENPGSETAALLVVYLLNETK
ncbi:MAG: XRE family transcriptional regulator [Victivallaceae bacterium]|nr:XRE family transcriptional regulator [Victivallaceae bacterium]